MSYDAPPPPPPPGQPGGPYAGGYGVPAGNNTKAVVSLVLGILGVVFALCCSILGLILGVVALVLGITSRNEIARSGGAQKGDGFGRAGFILGIVAIVIAVISIILGFVLRAHGYDPFHFNTSP